MLLLMLPFAILDSRWQGAATAPAAATCCSFLQACCDGRSRGCQCALRRGPHPASSRAVARCHLVHVHGLGLLLLRCGRLLHFSVPAAQPPAVALHPGAAFRYTRVGMEPSDQEVATFSDVDSVSDWAGLPRGDHLSLWRRAVRHLLRVANLRQLWSSLGQYLRELRACERQVAATLR